MLPQSPMEVHSVKAFVIIIIFAQHLVSPNADHLEPHRLRTDKTEVEAASRWSVGPRSKVSGEKPPTKVDVEIWTEWSLTRNSRSPIYEYLAGMK